MWDVQKGEKYDTWLSEDCSLKYNIWRINVGSLLIIRDIMLLCPWGCGDLKKKCRREIYSIK